VDIFNGSPANNIIGGLALAARNVISGNHFDGIGIFGLSGGNPTGTMIVGNFIGTNASGTTALPNGFTGISIDAASGNTVGGTQPGAGNVIAGNTAVGLLLVNGASQN